VKEQKRGQTPDFAVKIMLLWSAVGVTHSWIFGQSEFASGVNVKADPYTCIFRICVWWSGIQRYCNICRCQPPFTKLGKRIGATPIL
jgi:hypothetical protein